MRRRRRRRPGRRAPLRLQHQHRGRAVPGRAFVLFFDDVHLTQAEGDRAKVALAQFLERELRAGDLVSLVAPGTALRWHARMPDGRPELTRIVAGSAASSCPTRRPIT